jgi:hypothetical protein
MNQGLPEAISTPAGWKPGRATHTLGRAAKYAKWPAEVKTLSASRGGSDE